MNNSKPMWWNDKEDMAHTGIWNMVKKLHDQNYSRIEMNLINTRLYCNQPEYASTNPYSNYDSHYRHYGIESNKISYNLTAMVVDTITSKIAKNSPRVSFVTKNGSWTDRRRARGLTNFTLGQFKNNNIYEIGRKVFKSSCIEDVGAVKHFIQDKKIKSEIVMANELYVDHMDSVYGEPSHMYQIKYVSKNYLKNMYPDKSRRIEDSSTSIGGIARAPRQLIEEFVVVVESWKLPDANNKNGRHVISTSSTTLVDEEWSKNWFPFTFMRWNNKPMGFWGASLAEELIPFQLEVNKLMRDIKKSFDLLLAPAVWLPLGGKIPEAHVSNKIGRIIKSAAKPEIIGNGSIMPREAYSHLQWLIQSGFERAGVTQMSAAGRKPSGLDAAVALREFQDIESDRFAVVQKNYEEWFIRTSKIYIELAKDLPSSSPDLKDVSSLEDVNFKKIDLERDQYKLHLWSSSMLPETPSGRKQYLEELMNLGVMTMETLVDNLDIPDPDGEIARLVAGQRYFHKLAEKIMEDPSNYISPDPNQNIEKGITIMQQYYDAGMLENAPEESLEPLRIWMASAKDILTKASEAAVMAQQSQQGTTPALTTQQQGMDASDGAPLDVPSA